MTDFCNDYGAAPHCQGNADPQYTMDFTDVEPGCFIHFCVVCGPIAHGMASAINEAFETRPGFAEEFAAAIAQAESEQVKL